MQILTGGIVAMMPANRWSVWRSYQAFNDDLSPGWELWLGCGWDAGIALRTTMPAFWLSPCVQLLEMTRPLWVLPVCSPVWWAGFVPTKTQVHFCCRLPKQKSKHCWWSDIRGLCLLSWESFLLLVVFLMDSGGFSPEAVKGFARFERPLAEQIEDTSQVGPFGLLLGFRWDEVQKLKP